MEKGYFNLKFKWVTVKKKAACNEALDTQSVPLSLTEKIRDEFWKKIWSLNPVADWIPVVDWNSNSSRDFDSVPDHPMHAHFIV